MTGIKNIKLFKIASEINIGRETIVEYLQSKGFNIQNKPTATLDESMIEVVLDKFKREKKAADIQREKIQKHKDFRQEPKKTDERGIENSDEPASTKPHSEHNSVAEEHFVDTVKDIEEQATPTENFYPTIKQPVILGKIDLPDSNRHHFKEKQHHNEEQAKVIVPKKHESVIPKIEEVKAATIEPEVIVEQIEIPVEKIQESPKIDEVIEVDTVERKSETISTEVMEPLVVDTPVTPVDLLPEPIIESELATNTNLESESKVISEETNKEQASNSDAHNPELSDEENAIRRERRKKKKRTQPETEPGETPQLRGLTVVGKIDLRPKREFPPKRDVKFQKPEGGVKSDAKPDTKTDAKDKDKFKPKQFKKRKHTVETPADFKESAKEQLDSKFKVKEKEINHKEVVPIDDKKKRKKKKTVREMISQEEVNRAIRETLAGMDLAHASTRAKNKIKKRAEREIKEQKIHEEKLRDDKILKLTEFVTTSDLANLIGITVSEIILKCMQLGLMVTINQRLDKDTIILIADDYDFDIEFLDDKESQLEEIEYDPIELKIPRSPIVTIMGHVDHGKTSLLDYIRSANVVAGEAGGITQHIGAYKVELANGKTITFLDTPGHEAFTAMRARGAQVTDIVVLVVAADDSVMPQTIEAISHAKAANVPIIVAINKIDKADANPDRIKQQLTDQNILVEEWGGKFQAVEISAKKGLNIDTLLEKILLEAEFLELKANPDRVARGIVIESNMKQGFGPVATIIVQKGTLRVGDPFVAGVSFGKVRAMLDERERKITKAGPGDPVLVVGFDELPEAGDSFVATETDHEARETAIQRKQLKREQELRQIHHKTLDEISAQIQIGGVKDLNLVLKGDVAGSVEALADSLLKLSREEVKVNILHKGAGNITESDVMLASASNAVVIGFNIIPTLSAKKAADNEQVDIRLYSIIYDCINEIQLALEGLLTPEYKEEVVATIEVRKVFKISKHGSIAGCYVTNGKITRNDKVRVLRDGFKEFEGSLSSLKRGKDDVKEVDQNFECGIQFAGFNDVHEGDVIEAYKILEIKRKLV